MATNNAIGIPVETIGYTNFATTTTGGLIFAHDTYLTLAGEGTAVFYLPLDGQILPGQSFTVISGDPAGWQLVPDTDYIIRWIDNAGVVQTADGATGQRLYSNGPGSQTTTTSATVMYVQTGYFVVTSFTGLLTVV